MQQSDLDGIARSSALAHDRGLSFHANPHYAKAGPWDTDERLLEWHTVASAWASGWLERDAGRDFHIARLMHLPSW